ncbi:two-component regulator propeller domain-containing protein [Pseudoalteromonas piscicida]|uniref:histidine kinase n=2 Tax=Pseudoalteromonas piscicida TaxID=43662 RepID=A0AAD0W5F0_PSEO7|nr:two-component regulator propeller domain-containing protein [Pseudoalteromonas piscicida]ASD68481.1 hypothetical protein B1L02_16630 [Pseudoalteromonas piscicida]AXR03532.1 hypothetical protein D0511_16685 [Pseudoalteromonas piscicida]
MKSICKPFIFSLLFFSLVKNPVYANDDLSTALFRMGELHFERLDTESFPSKTISAVFQDKAGFIWFGTQEGLMKFDGYDYTLFRKDQNNKNSLTANYVDTIWQAPNNNIWLGTYSNGVSIFDVEKKKFINLSASDDSPYKLLGNKVYKISGHDSGLVAVATKGGITIIDLNNGETLDITEVKGCDSNYSSNFVRYVVWQSESILWAGNEDGLCRLKIDVSEKHFSGTSIPEFNGYYVRSLLLDEEYLWVGTANNIARLTLNDNNIHFVINDTNTGPLTTKPVMDILKIHNDEMWVSTFGNGIHIIDRSTLRLLETLNNDPSNYSTISLDKIGEMIQDVSGIIWVGTWGAGVNKLNRGNQTIRALKYSAVKGKGLSFDNILALTVRKNGELWLGSGSGKLQVASPHSGKVKSDAFFNARNQAEIYGMSEDRDGDLWISTIDSVYLYNPELTRLERVLGNDEEQSVIYEGVFIGDDNVVLIKSSRGLLEYDKGSKVLSNVPLTEKLGIVVMAKDEQGGYWIGTETGLYQLSENYRSLLAINERTGTASGLGEAPVNSLLIDSNDILWVESDDGIYQLIERNSGKYYFDSVNKKLGLDNTHLGSNLLQDRRGRVWTSKFIIDTERWTFNKLKKAAGWDIGEHWNGSRFQSESGLTVRGGSKGVILSFPEQYEGNSYEPELVFTRISADGDELNTESNRLMIDSDVKTLDIEFSALDYFQPSQNQYAYKLEGYDESWRVGTNRKVTYPRLHGGEYRFIVKGSNSDGVWSKKRLELTIIKERKFFEKTSTKIVLVSLFILLVYFVNSLFNWVKVKKLKEEQQRLNNLVNERTKEIEKLGLIGKRLTAHLEVQEVVKQLYNNISSIMDCYVFLVGIINEEKETLDYIASYEDGQELPYRSLELRKTDRPGPWCVTNNQLFYAENGEEQAQILGKRPEPIAGAKCESIIYLPLEINNLVVGCLSVQSLRKRAYDENSIQILLTIGAYAAVALNNARTLNSLLETQQRLAESERMASIGHLVTGVAHEMNTPIGVALTSSSIIGDQTKTLHQRMENKKLTPSHLNQFIMSAMESNKLIESSLNRCSELTRKFKEISVSQLYSESKVIELREFLYRVFEGYEKQLGLKNIKKYIDCPSCSFEVDINILTQIFNNLILNSITHGFASINQAQVEEQWIKVQVECSHKALHITFSDNGVGMTAETKEQVFTPFYTTKKGAAEHTGLGMSIVYNLVVFALKGTLSVESEANKGCICSITLPMN